MTPAWSVRKYADCLRPGRHKHLEVAGGIADMPERALQIALIRAGSKS